MKILLALALMFIGSPIAAQTPSFDEVASHLRTQFAQVEDYQVNITVKLKLPGIRMPRKRMTLSFKQPDKVKLKSLGFAMVPRRGLAFSPDSLMKDLRDISVADTTINDAKYLALRGTLPVGKDDEAVLVDTEILIDPARWVMISMSTRIDSSELFTMTTSFIEPVKGIYLPEVTTLTFHGVEDMMGGRRPPFHPGGRSRKRNSSEADSTAAITVESGEAVIQFKKYKVNQGLPDSFFEENDGSNN